MRNSWEGVHSDRYWYTAGYLTIIVLINVLKKLTNHLFALPRFVTVVKIQLILQWGDGAETEDDLSSPMLTSTDTASIASPSLAQRRPLQPASVSRQASRNNLLQAKLNLPISGQPG